MQALEFALFARSVSLCCKSCGLPALKACYTLWACVRPVLGPMHAGSFVVGGVQLGNVWIGVQPALGVEGDPMRLLFERDLTPHPQYAAFYRVWLQQRFAAHAVLHFGMHGTVEWLPGAPLGAPFTPGAKCVGCGGMQGGTGLSWGC